MSIDNVVCSSCGTEIDTSGDTSDFRVPCSNCGDRTRTYNASIVASVTARAGLGVKAKRPGEKKPFVEDMGVPSHSRSLDKLVHHERLIDRDNNIYREKITDYETGEIIHHCEEPLTEHRGHGSAKSKKDSADG